MAIKLFNGKEIPSAVSTLHRIFQVETYDGDIVLCNIVHAQDFIKDQECKRIKHYWNHKFQTIGKKEVLEMSIINQIK